MLINQQNLNALYNDFNTLFNKAFSEKETQYEKIAMEVPSNTTDETYSWLGGLPSMREWMGERVVKNLSGYTYTITNKDFELTVSIPRNAIEDDRLGIYKPFFQDLAERAKQLPDELIFNLLINSFENKCFDGKPFISDNHELEINSKKIAQSNKGNKKLTATSYNEARVQMMTIKGENNKSLSIIPNLLVVSPQYEAIAKSITMLDLIGGTTNINKGTAEVLVVPELADTPDYWFLLCTNRAIRPFIFQNRRAVQLINKDNPTDDNLFWNKEIIYGADSRCNAGYGLWQLAFGSTGEAEA